MTFESQLLSTHVHASDSANCPLCGVVAFVSRVRAQQSWTSTEAGLLAAVGVLDGELASMERNLQTFVKSCSRMIELDANHRQEINRLDQQCRQMLRTLQGIEPLCRTARNQNTPPGLRQECLDEVIDKAGAFSVRLDGRQKGK